MYCILYILDGINTGSLDLLIFKKKSLSDPFVLLAMSEESGQSPLEKTKMIEWGEVIYDGETLKYTSGTTMFQQTSLATVLGSSITAKCDEPLHAFWAM